MSWGFTDWDGASIYKAGSIKRASSSNDKVWGEQNKTETDLPYGTFVAVNPEGGIKKLTKADEVVHGIVVLDIYSQGAPANRHVNVGHFSHGDCVVAQGVTAQDFARGDKVFVVATGADAGKVTKVAAGNIDLGYWVDSVSKGNDCVAITLGYAQKVGA